MAETTNGRGGVPAGTGSSGPIPTDELAGMLAARRALGTENEDAVIAAFLERTGAAIDARVDSALAARAAWSQAPAPGGPQRVRGASGAWVALGSMVLAIPLSGIATQFNPVAAIVILLITWVGIVAVNVLYHRQAG